jgi:hypothetical protein
VSEEFWEFAVSWIDFYWLELLEQQIFHRSSSILIMRLIVIAGLVCASYFEYEHCLRLIQVSRRPRSGEEGKILKGRNFGEKKKGTNLVSGLHLLYFFRSPRKVSQPRYRGGEKELAVEQ